MTNHDFLSVGNLGFKAKHNEISSVQYKPKSESYIVFCLDRIHRDYKNRKLSGLMLAQLMSLSERHLVRIFKTHIGVTPNQYINRYRLSIGRKLLESGVTLQKVAKLSGFSSPNYFARQFRREYGYSPREYLKQYPTQRI